MRGWGKGGLPSGLLYPHTTHPTTYDRLADGYLASFVPWANSGSTLTVKVDGRPSGRGARAGRRCWDKVAAAARGPCGSQGMWAFPRSQCTYTQCAPCTEHVPACLRWTQPLPSLFRQRMSTLTKPASMWRTPTPSLQVVCKACRVPLPMIAAIHLVWGSTAPCAKPRGIAGAHVPPPANAVLSKPLSAGRLLAGG